MRFHVLPAHVKHAPVGQHRRGVLLLGVVGEHADVPAVGVAAVERGHLRAPTGDKAVAAAGTKDDAAIGRVDRLDVVVGAVGELAEVLPVDVDLL
ncbi:MAG: hypothetical protein QM813_06185 [Verrucomicrobiota bacterium]